MDLADLALRVEAMLTPLGMGFTAEIVDEQTSLLHAPSVRVTCREVGEEFTDFAPFENSWHERSCYSTRIWPVSYRGDEVPIELFAMAALIGPARRHTVAIQDLVAQRRVDSDADAQLLSMHWAVRRFLKALKAHENEEVSDIAKSHLRLVKPHGIKAPKVAVAMETVPQAPKATPTPHSLAPQSPPGEASGHAPGLTTPERYELEEHRAHKRSRSNFLAWALASLMLSTPVYFVLYFLLGPSGDYRVVSLLIGAFFGFLVIRKMI